MSNKKAPIFGRSNTFTKPHSGYPEASRSLVVEHLVKKLPVKDELKPGEVPVLVQHLYKSRGGRKRRSIRRTRRRKRTLKKN